MSDNQALDIMNKQDEDIQRLHTANSNLRQRIAELEAENAEERRMRNLYFTELVKAEETLRNRTAKESGDE